VEAIAPVCDPVIKAELEDILRTYEEDNSSAWDMQPDGEYVRRHPGRNPHRSRRASSRSPVSGVRLSDHWTVRRGRWSLCGRVDGLDAESRG
jgi:polyphosphate kinase